MTEDLILIGKIIKTHGIKGDLIAFFYTEDYKNLSKYEKFYSKNKQELKISFKSKPNYQVTEDKNTDYIKYIININSISDINKSMHLIGQEIFIDKNNIQIEHDEFLISDLINLEIYKNEDRDFKIGKVKDIHDFGGGVIIEIDSEIKEFQTFNMFNFDNQSFPEIDLQNKKTYLAVNPSEITELLDEEYEVSDNTINTIKNSWEQYLANKKN
jgi:16S rRNA processing protein RimM